MIMQMIMSDFIFTVTLTL